jgi:hypothetical protein
MSGNWWDSLTSTLGSDFEVVKDHLVNTIQSLGLGEIEEYIPQVYHLLLFLGESNPVPIIVDIAQLLASNNPYSLVVEKLRQHVSPVTAPVAAGQIHKTNMASTLQTHWSGIHSRIDQLRQQDQFRGPASQSLQSQHEALRVNAQVLHDYIVNTSQADNKMLSDMDSAILEKANEITNLGLIGPFAFLAAFHVSTSLMTVGFLPSSTPTIDFPSAPPLDPDKVVEELFRDFNPFDPQKPLIVRILLGIAEALAAIDLVMVAVIVSALALLIGSILLLWIDSHPVRHLRYNYSRNLRPQPAPTPVPVASASTTQEAIRIAEVLRNKYGIDVDASDIADLLARGYTEQEIISLLSNLKATYGPNKTVLKTNLAALLDGNYGKNETLQIARIMARVKQAANVTVLPASIADLLEANFSENQTIQALKNLGTIYGDDPDAIDNAVYNVLNQNFDVSTTTKIFQKLQEHYQQMLKNGESTPSARACIDSIVNGLNFDPISPKPFPPASLQEHYRNHRNDRRFNATSPEDYQQQAKDFMDGSPTPDELQITRASNGYIIRWNMQTGEFGIVNSNGTLISYYNIKDSTDPMKYVLQQACK